MAHLSSSASVDDQIPPTSWHGHGSIKALLIPADPSRSVGLIEINGRDDLRSHVGGLPEPTQYDYDAIMCVSDTGRIDGQPKNMRATEYIRTESEAAKQGRMIGIDPSCASTAKSWWSEMPSRAYGTCLIDWSNASGPHATFRLATGFAMCFKIATRTE